LQYHKAVNGTREILIFGAMIMKLEVVLELQNNSHGPQTKGMGLKGWIEEHCPDINYKTAFSFYRFARGMRETMRIKDGTDIPKLLMAPQKELSTSESKIRTEIDDVIFGKSQRQLEFDFGIRRTPVRPTGGARDGAGRPKFSHTLEQANIDAMFSKGVLGDWAVAVLEKRWHLRIDEEKQSVLLEIARAIVRDLSL
jgi:hypothetical protein